MRRVEAVVDDADLHPVARGVEVRAPECVGADLFRAAGVAQRVVAHIRPDLGDALNLSQLRDLGAGQDDCEPVRHEPVVPAHVCRRQGRLHALCDDALLGVDASQIVAVRRGQQPPSEDRQRLPVQRHDHLGHRVGLCALNVARQCDGGNCRHQEEERDSLQSAGGRARAATPGVAARRDVRANGVGRHGHMV